MYFNAINLYRAEMLFFVLQADVCVCGTLERASLAIMNCTNDHVSMTHGRLAQYIPVLFMPEKEYFSRDSFRLHVHHTIEILFVL